MTSYETEADELWETRVATTGSAMSYPQTPDLAARWREESPSVQQQARPLRWAVAIVAVAAVLVAALVATPLRATLLEWLRVGAVWVELGDGGEQALELPSTHAASAELATFVARLGESITLADATERATFAVRRPALLPEPDEVYFYRAFENEVVTLVWNGESDEPTAILQLFGPGSWILKQQPPGVQATLVGGENALWTTGPYWAVYPRELDESRHLVENHALIWQDEETTYRLESAMSLADAVLLAESLQPVAPTPAEGEESP